MINLLREKDLQPNIIILLLEHYLTRERIITINKTYTKARVRNNRNSIKKSQSNEQQELN